MIIIFDLQIFDPHKCLAKVLQLVFLDYYWRILQSVFPDIFVNCRFRSLFTNFANYRPRYFLQNQISFTLLFWIMFLQILQIVFRGHSISKMSLLIIFFLQNLQNILAGFDLGRLVKVGDAKIAFLFQVERRLTETSTQPHLRDVRHKQWRNSERKRPAQRFEACDGRERNGFDADFPFCSTVFF